MPNIFCLDRYYRPSGQVEVRGVGRGAADDRRTLGAIRRSIAGRSPLTSASGTVATVRPWRRP